MRKSDVVKHVADVADLSNNEADNAVSAIIEQVTNALARGESISLIGFGNFSVKNRPARIGRNPRTGESMQISASNQVQFKPGKNLKQALNS